MKPNNQNIWEDLVTDYLEVACSLPTNQRNLLVGHLKSQGLQAPSIRTHPTFSSKGRLIVILQAAAIQECWLFYPQAEQITKFAVKRMK